MRILLIILAFLALLTSLAFIAVLNQLVPAIALLVIGSILLLGTLLGRKVAAQFLILFCTVLIISITGSAFYQTQGFTGEQFTQYSYLWWLIGLGVGLALAIAVAFGVLLLSSDYIFVAQGISWERALVYLFSWMTGLFTIYREVKDGEVKETRIRSSPDFGAFFGRLFGLGRLLGVGEIVSIHSQQAVVFERGGKFTRVEGPGIVFAKPWEYVHRVFTIRPRFVELVLEEAYTKDGIPLNITFTILYRLIADVPRDAIDWKKPYPVSKDAVVKAAYATFDWEMAVREEAKNLLRDRFAQTYLDEIYDPLNPETFPLREIRTDIKDGLAEFAWNWGMEIRAVQIVRLDMPDKVKEQMLRRWFEQWEARVAESKKQAMITLGEGEAEASRIVELARASTQTQMIIAITEGFRRMKETGTAVPDLIALRFLETVEKMAANPATKFMLPYAVFDTLKEIRGSLTDEDQGEVDTTGEKPS
jgi:regulator of protease activity HflC (stomatin/prohibitin superfamily)